MESEDPFAEFVTHPRYGKRPIASGQEVPAEFYRGRWHFPWQEGWRFPESAILADVSRQAPSVVPLQAYVDHRVDCRMCGRPFLFFALEMTHWYEELRFNQSARCLECPECRKQNQRTRAIRRRQEELLTRQNELDDAGWLELAAAYAELYRQGVMKTPEKVKWALNRIRDREASGPAIGQLRVMIESQRS